MLFFYPGTFQSLSTDQKIRSVVSCSRTSFCQWFFHTLEDTKEPAHFGVLWVCKRYHHCAYRLPVLLNLQNLH